MTRPANDPDRFTPFSHWLRALPAPLDSASVSNQNLDYIWHNYRASWFITIEEKRYGASVSAAQSDTHNIVRQLCEYGSGQEIETMRGKRKVEYRGHYVVRFEQTTPDDSRWIMVNDEFADKESLLDLLRTGTHVQPARFGHKGR